MNETPLIRPDWNYLKDHKEKWQVNDITVVICERDTADVTKLCLESILRFYPDIMIRIVDGGSVDDSLNYVRMLKVKHPNIEVWERAGRNGHGTMLDGAIRGFIRTKYILLADNDIIINRGGWIEDMLAEMNRAELEGKPIYALGSMMVVTNSGDGCGPPKDDNDKLFYTHPSCSLIDRRQYLQLAPFVEHGAPLVYNMQDAQKRGLRVEYFPIEKYVSHLSGASWTTPYRTVWKNDMDVMIRPFFTFVIRKASEVVMLEHQIYKDFDIIMSDSPVQAKVHIFGVGNFDVDSGLFPIRFKVRGEYVCMFKGEPFPIPADHLYTVKQILTNQGLPDEYETDNIKIVKRKIWQSREAML